MISCSEMRTVASSVRHVEVAIHPRGAREVLTYLEIVQAMHRQRKCVFKELCQCSVRCAQCAASVHVTATETPRGERMCANSGRIYGDNVQEMHTQRRRRRQW